MEKGETAYHEQFLLFPQCFLPFSRTFGHFHRTSDCCSQTLSVRKNLKFSPGVPSGSVVMCLTLNPEDLGSSRTGSSEFFRRGVLWQDTSEPQPSTGETQERHE